MTPQNPHAPCTAKASRGSSIFFPSSVLGRSALDASGYQTPPPKADIQTAWLALTVLQLAVMETRPARIPFKVAERSAMPMVDLSPGSSVLHSGKIQEKQKQAAHPPVHPAIAVFMIAVVA
mmetsp:Transcript_37364/g.68987  ORF Transcript_37364/g.68987 Transcript_37364/m.68987 type:complete len:121 (-) Transcript_37364:934-1296(-)